LLSRKLKHSYSSCEYALGAHRVGKIEFSGEITIEDILATIERQVGTGSAAGWQKLQAKAGIRSS
jgi:hypothetical protein